jgi:uncharacterized protein YjbI with pentapeptide repeats
MKACAVHPRIFSAGELEQARAAGLTLADCDLSALSLDGMEFPPDMRFERVVFSAARPTRRRTIMNAQLRHCIFENCCFAGSEMVSVAFRGASFTGCDFRYARFQNVTFAEADLVRCDLYRALFEGNNVFERAELLHCSLNLTAFTGADIHRDNMKRAVVQEFEQAYREHLEASGGHLGYADIECYVDLRRQEAAAIYRALSGHWAGAGSLGDAAWAYVRARRLEAQCHRPPFTWRAPAARALLRRQAPPSRWSRARLVLAELPHYLSALAADLSCGFGASVHRVLFTGLVTLAAFAAVYHRHGALLSAGKPASFAACIVFSLHKAIGLTPDGMSLLRYEPIAAAETAIGLFLLGLFGFVFGNYVRNS